MSYWTLRTKPTGPFQLASRAASMLYRVHLGSLLGERFLTISSRDRTTGLIRRTTVEIVEHDHETGEFIVCSGTGAQADWYLDLRAKPALVITVGAVSWRPHQRLLDSYEAAERFHRYELAHPTTARALLHAFGRGYDGTPAGRVRLMDDLPIVAFSDRRGE